MKYPETYSLIKSLYLVLISSGMPITNMGIFGSSTHDDEAKDIDVLLVLDPEEKPNEIMLTKLIEIVESRIKGDYSHPAPTDPFVKKSAQKCLEIIKENTNLPILYGLGPANPHSHKGRWIHLNGPITGELWRRFTLKFPVHAAIIRNNYIPIAGDFPFSPGFSGEDLLKHCNEHAERFKTTSSLKYINKLIKTLGLLSGEKSSDFNIAIEAAFKKKSPFPRLMKSIENESEKRLFYIANSILDVIRGYAKMMKFFNIHYPKDWPFS